MAIHAFAVGLVEVALLVLDPYLVDLLLVAFVDQVSSVLEVDPSSFLVHDFAENVADVENVVDADVVAYFVDVDENCEVADFDSVVEKVLVVIYIATQTEKLRINH